MDAAPRPLRLRVRFVSGRNPRVAEQAARCMDALARGRLDIEVAHEAGDRAPATGNLPSLVVVIHVVAEPAPLVADECGGRVDWHLGREALTDDTAELMAHLRRHAARLLGDLGHPAPPCALRSATRPANSAVPRTPALLAAA
ncbi:hypothetical protein [Thiobacillus denitrificans]|uniref:hypothetical protein n=1 Tax=Thiobacillus denitrificans TaxID=36861 RepID=UPI00164F8CE0|nr:hypothetical protein [Thiobacillus denitrificans]